MPGAHQALITAIDFTQYGGKDVIFTAGQDCMLKAWCIDRQANTFSPIDAK